MRTLTVAYMMDSKQLKRWLTKQGYQLTLTGSGHIRVWCPEGNQLLATIPNTPRDGRHSVQNTVAILRRIGVPVPRK